MMRLSNKIDLITKLLKSFSGIIKWRKYPGCFERHLQRRYKNLLFSPDRRNVTLLDLDYARQKDDAERNAFHQKTKNLTRDFPSDEEFPDKMLENIRNYYRQTGELIEESFHLGDSTLIDREQLLILEKADLDFLIKHQPNQKKDFLDYQALSDLTRIAWFQQINRLDSPIHNDEDVASLLSEDIITIRNIAAYFTMMERANPTPISIIDRAKMVAILENAYKQGFDRAKGQVLLNAYNEGTSVSIKD